MALDEAERAEIAARLLNTLEPDSDADHEAAWQTEIRSRLSQSEAGTMETIPLPEARELIRGAGTSDAQAG